jgi:hypothetical protein
MVTEGVMAVTVPMLLPPLSPVGASISFSFDEAQGWDAVTQDAATHRMHFIMPCTAGALALMLVFSEAQASATSRTCPVVDAIEPLSVVAAATAGKSYLEQIDAYRGALIDAHPGLYTRQVLGLESGPLLERQILASLAQTRAARARDALIAQVRDQIVATSETFGRVFLDFSCNFTVYLTDSLGLLDGAGRAVDGRPALVIGISSIEQELPRLSLPVLFNHEFFHRYHFEVAGFSDDPGGNQEIWRTLWAEGLATYVSKMLTPDATTADALLSAHLEQRARPLERRLARELLSGMDRIDGELFEEFFTSGPEAGRHGFPNRTGYYVGYLVATRLAEHHRLSELAHLKGDVLHQEIAASLRELAAYNALARVFGGRPNEIAPPLNAGPNCLGSGVHADLRLGSVGTKQLDLCRGRLARIDAARRDLIRPSGPPA